MPQVETVQAQTASPVQPQVVYVEKKSGGGGGKCFLIGCCAIIACCVLTVCGLGGLVYFGGASILSSNKTADASLTRITSASEAQSAINSASVNTQPVVDPKTGLSTMTWTEKDILGLTISVLEISDTPNKVGVKISPDSAKLEIDLGALANVINKASENSTDSTSSSMDLKGLDNIFASITFSVGPDGKTIKVKEVSLGNGFLDSLLGPSLIQGFEKSIQENIIEGKDKDGTVNPNTPKVEKIQLLSGKMVITYAESATP